MINADAVFKEAIENALIRERIDEICKKYTPYTHPIHYSMLKQSLINRASYQIQWYGILGCTFIDHSIKIKDLEVKPDEH